MKKETKGRRLPCALRKVDDFEAASFLFDFALTFCGLPPSDE